MVEERIHAVRWRQSDLFYPAVCLVSPAFCTIVFFGTLTMAGRVCTGEFPRFKFRFALRGLQPHLSKSMFTFHDGHITVERQIGKSLNRAAGLRPFDFDPVKFQPFPNSKDHSRIVR